MKFRGIFHFYALKMAVERLFGMFYLSEDRHGVKPQKTETDNFCGSQTPQQRHCSVELQFLELNFTTLFVYRLHRVYL